MKKRLITIILCVALISSFSLIGAYALGDPEPEHSDIYKKITTDGTFVVNAMEPDNWNDAYALLSSILTNIVKDDGYEVYAQPNYEYDEQVDSYTSFKIDLRETWDPDEVYDPTAPQLEPEIGDITVTYVEPSKEIQDLISPVLAKMKNLTMEDFADFSKFYQVDDLYMINYLRAFSDASSDKRIALNFSKEFIEATNAPNISFELVVHAGADDEINLYDCAIGDVLVYIDDTIYTTKFTGVVCNHLLGIPDTTENTTAAYVAAAQKRLDDYLGKGVAEVAYGGTLDSLTIPGDGENREDYTYNTEHIYDDVTLDGNYYNITINDISYRFVLTKKPAAELTTPTYVASNLQTKIRIESDATQIPLDTSIKANALAKSEELKSLVGTDDYQGFEISLFSNTAGTKVEKLKNGEFRVFVPAKGLFESEALPEKVDVICPEDEDFKAKGGLMFIDDIAYFEFYTGHFSKYVLYISPDEKAEEKIADTNDAGSIATFALLMGASLIGTVALKKREGA